STAGSFLTAKASFAARAEAPLAALSLEERPRRQPLLGIEPAVAVLVELLDKLAPLIHESLARTAEALGPAEVFFLWLLLLIRRRLRRQDRHRDDSERQDVAWSPLALIHPE